MKRRSSVPKIVLLAGMIFVLACALAPAIAGAAHASAKTDVWDVTILKGPLITCTGNTTVPMGSAIPPCQNLCDFFSTFVNVLYFAIALCIWIILPICFVIAGFLFLTSRGSPEGTSRAKGMLTGSLWAVAIILGAYLIVSTFVNALGISQYIGYFGNGGTCNVQQSDQCGGCPTGEACVPPTTAGGSYWCSDGG